jgi:RNA polymerase sigma factor (sigma-70 family)
MARGPGAAAVGELLAERGDQLIRAAVALAGSRADGEDLLQAALERLLLSRRRVTDLEGYLRRILYNLAADGWRRRATAERRLRLVRGPGVSRGDSGGTDPADALAAVDLRDALVQLLDQLPSRQRTVIVLRYWLQLSEAEIAAILGCSQGGVKSNASRGMARLRELAAAWTEDDSVQQPLTGELWERTS